MGRNVLLTATILCIASMAWAEPQYKQTKGNAAQDQRGTKQQPLVIEGIPAQKDETVSREERQHRAKQIALTARIDKSLTAIARESENTGELTFLLFGATGVLALVTWLLVLGTERTAKRQLRAYVALDDIYFPWVPKPRDPSNRQHIVKGSQVKVKIKNFGQTPAMNITLRLCGTSAPMEGEFERIFGGKDYIGPRLMLSPTQSYANRVSKERFVFNGNKPLDPEGKEPFIFGAIIYQDIFNRWWVTHFCYHYDCDPKSKNRFIPHSKYNYETQHCWEWTAKRSLRYDPNIIGAYRGEQAGGKVNTQE